MIRRIALSAAFLSAASPAFAHSGAHEHGSFMAGFVHPFSGADHVLAMVVVGLWAALLGGRALVAVPAGFVAAMVAGFGLALTGTSLPLVEPAILASVVVLGLCAAMAARLPAAVCAAIVGPFALFHGFAHGGEMAASSAPLYGLGFVGATALLHAAGIAGGTLLAGFAHGWPARALGGATALAGVALMAG